MTNSSVAQCEAVHGAADGCCCVECKDGCRKPSARQNRGRRTADRTEVDLLRGHDRRRVVCARRDMNRRAVWCGVDGSGDAGVTRAADDELSRAFVRNAVAVEVGGRTSRDVAGVRLAVAVAVERESTADVA